MAVLARPWHQVACARLGMNMSFSPCAERLCTGSALQKNAEQYWLQGTGHAADTHATYRVRLHRS
jgi:hypothetical protein